MRKIGFLIFFILGSVCVSQNIQQQTSQNDYFLAENYYREGAFEKATQLFQKLYTASPFNSEYLARLLSCYQQTDRYLDAELLLKNRIGTNNKQLYLYVYLGYNYQLQKQEKKAQENYTIALNSLETIPSYGDFLGQLFKEYGLLNKAILAYEKAMTANKNANYNFQIAQIYGEQGNYKAMFESYINMVDENDQYFSLVQRYASQYITEDAENEANILFRKTLLKKSASNPKNAWNALLSWLFTQQKDYAKAFVQEKALYQRTSESLDAIFRLGTIAFENQFYEDSKNCFAFVVNTALAQKEILQANLYLAKIAVVTKSPETEALFQNIFTTYGKNTNTLKIQVAYADFLIFSENKPNQANAILTTALTFANSKFDKASIKLKLADVYVFTGKFSKALIYYSQIQTELKNHELGQEARFKVAQTSYFKGDFKWAKAQLKVLKSSTTQLIANDAVALFLKITDNEPVDAVPSGLKQLANAELLAYQNKDNDALAVLNDLISSKDILLNGLTPAEVIYDDVYFFRAKLYVKLKAYDAAIEDLTKIITADTQGILADDIYFLMAEIYQQNLNNAEKAKEYYQKIIFDYPTSIFLVDARNRYRKLRGDQI